MQNITDLYYSLLGNVPDIILALLVLVLAFFVSWVAKKLALKLTKFLGLERAMAKAGISQKNIKNTTSFIGRLVHLIVFILFLPGIFEKLGLNNVATPIVTMMNSLLAYLPNIIGAVVILIIGLFIAKIVKELLTPLLDKLGLNAWLKRIGVASKINFPDLLSTIVYAVIVVIFAIEAISTLQLDILTRLGAGLVDYLPFALSAALILAIAFLLGTWSEVALVNKLKTSTFTGLAAKVAIITTGVFMALSQLGIASGLVNATFVILVGSVGVAFAVSFGLGGRDFAAHTMKKLEKKLDDKSRK